MIFTSVAFYLTRMLASPPNYSPFSIESLENPETNQIARGYAVLQQLSPLILANQGKGTMAGALLDSAHQKTQLPLGDFIFNVRHE